MIFFGIPNFIFILLFFGHWSLYVQSYRPLRIINLIDDSSMIRTNITPIDYSKAWEWQKKLVFKYMQKQNTERKSDHTVGTIIILEHRPVYTLGSATELDSGPFDRFSPNERLDYDIFQVERGGQATFHGPGQLVIYPILDLHYFEKDIHSYLRGLETVSIKTLNDFGVKGTTINGLTGVWVDNKKFSAIGIKLKRWITMHGMSINVCPDMKYFSNIIPCGIKDEGKSVGCISELNIDVKLHEVANSLLLRFCEHFEADCVEMLSGQQGIDYLDNIPALVSTDTEINA